MKTPQTSDEFNEFWKDFLETGHYGMAIEDAQIITYLHEEFGNEIAGNPNFSFSQIKLKFGSARIYTTSEHNSKWEHHIDKLLKVR